jgi:hypothetical protein
MGMADELIERESRGGHGDSFLMGIARTIGKSRYSDWLGRKALGLLYDFAAERSSYLLIRKTKLAESENDLSERELLLRAVTRQGCNPS